MCTEHRDRGEVTGSQQETTEDLGHHSSDLDQDAGGANGEQERVWGLILKIEWAGLANGSYSQRDTFSQLWCDSVLFSYLSAPVHIHLNVFGFKTGNISSSYTPPSHLC